MSKTIEQTVTFKATPREVYEALMDSRKHSQFTAAQANISRNVGGEFTAYDGGIRGKNQELVPHTKIVQSWLCRADGWPQDHFSELTITLRAVKGGTRLRLIQTDVPDAAYDICTHGWREAYWEKMKAAFEW